MRAVSLSWMTVTIAGVLASCGPAPGYHGGKVVCGCHDPDTCYAGAAETASRKGENAETAEPLMYFSQCACFQGSRAGCNTLAHFAKDWTAACEDERDVATSCTIAGLVHEHGVQVPRLAGRSFDANPAKAKAAFERACQAGSRIACERRPGG